MDISHPLNNPVFVLRDGGDQADRLYALKGVFIFAFFGPFEDFSMSAYPACQLSGKEHNTLGCFDSFARNVLVGVDLFFSQSKFSWKIMGY